MTLPPDVSVLIPTLNRAYILWKAMESVLGQSFTNLELIVIDDGSHDCTPRLVEEFRDPRVRYLNVPRGPAGLSAARNMGLRQSRGRLIAYLDSDDTWPANFLAEMYAASELFKSVGVFYAQQRAVIWERTSAGEWKWIRERVSQYKNFTQADVEDLRWPGITGIVHRRDVLESVNGFDEELGWLEDWDFFYRVLRSGAECRLVPDLYVNYRQVHGSGADGICSEARESRVREVNFRRQILEKWRSSLSPSAIERLSISVDDIFHLRAGPVSL